MNAPINPRDFAKPRLPEPGYRGLKHLPGRDGLAHVPYLDTVRFLSDPYAHTLDNYRRFGSIFRVNHFSGWHAVLLGPEANELVLFDRDRIFSSEEGWGPILNNLFPRGLMLMDFDVHRIHRKALSVAFKPEPMKSYLGALSAGVGRRVALWAERGRIKAYPEIKQLTLDLAATSFLGVDWGAEARAINRAFFDMVQAAVGVVRKPLPGTKMARGVRGRAYMCAFFARELPKRRGSEGSDIFTHICNAEGEDGQPLSNGAIIDHMNFLMMAAHDTLTSSLTSAVYYLGLYPEWQDRLREEVRALRDEVGPELPYERLGDLPLVEMAFKEALRINPPVPSLPRRALAAFEFGGYQVPAGTHIGVNPLFTHRMAELWPDPLAFNPLRFAPEPSRTRHKYAWVPYGGGAHMCLGLHFATMQAKSFFYGLLPDHRILLDPGYRCPFQLFPMPKPKDGLPLIIERLDARA